MNAPAVDDAVLRRFLLGTLPAAEAEAVARWVEQDPSATDRLGRIDARDPVVDAAASTAADTAGGGSSAPLVPLTQAGTGYPSDPDPLPAVVGEYRVVRELGRGGMGVVLEAENAFTGRRVAVKLIAPGLAADPGARARFLGEARAAARVEHPNVVPILHVGESGGRPYIVMPLLAGETLDARLKRDTRLAADDLDRLARELAAGLAAAHAAGLVHRDIKPANVWLDPAGRAVILDFGLAKLIADGADGLTATGTIMGTVHYMSPEQAEGLPVDARTDLFSLGAVLYHAATGRRPFTGDSKLAVLVSVKADTPEPPEALNPVLPPHLCGLIRRLLAKRNEERPPSAAAVTAALDAPEPVRRRPRRWVAVAAGLLAGALVAVIAADVIVIRGKDGKVVAEVPLPEGGSVAKVDGKGKVTPLVVPPPAPVAGRSPFDALDPARIPAAERFPWQPKELVAVLGEHRQRYWAPTRYLRVSPDGKQIAAFVGDHKPTFTAVWDVPTQRELHRIQDPLDGRALDGYPVGFMPDGKLVTQLAVWDISGREPRRLSTFKQSIGRWACFTPDGRTAVDWDGANGDARTGQVRIWDIGGDAWTVRHTFPESVEAALSPNGSTVAVVAAKTGRVTFFSLAERVPRPVGELPTPTGVRGAFDYGMTVAFVANDRLVTTDGTTLRLWTLGGPQPVAVVEAKSSDSGLAGVTATGKVYCYTGNVGVQVWDSSDDKLTLAASVNTGDRHASNLTGAQLTPDGKCLVTTHINGALRFWDVAGKASTERQPLAIQPFGGRFSLAGRHLLNRTETGHWGIQIWDMGNPTPLAVPDTDGLLAGADVGGHVLSPDGERFHYWRGGSLSLGRIRDGKVTSTHRFPHAADSEGAWSGDGKRFAVLVAENLLVYDVTADPPRLTGEAHCPLHVATLDFTRTDGSRLVARLADRKTPDESLATFAVENGMVREVSRVAIPPAFGPNLYGPVQSLSPDGTTLVLAATKVGPGLRVYDVTGDTPRVRAEGDFGIGGYILSVHLMADNRTVAFASNGRVGLLDLEKRRVLRAWDLPDTPRQVAVTADGRHLVTGNPNGTIYVLRLDGPR